MKTIKSLSAFLLLFSFSLFYTQTWSFDITDYVVAGTKTGITAGLGGEIYLKDEQNKLLEKLIKLEKEIDDKKSVANINSLALAAASIATIETTKKDIKDIKKVINIIKFNPLFLKHSLLKKAGDLDTEDKYLDEARFDYYRYLASGILSGGVGQVYTVFGKLLTRILNTFYKTSLIRKRVII